MNIKTLLCVLLFSSVSFSAAELPVMKEHEVFKKTYVVKNPYNHAVKVDKLDSTCKCQTLKIAKKFLLPHEETTVDMAVDNTNQSGTYTRRIWVNFTRDDLESIEIASTWIIMPTIAIDAIPAWQKDITKRPEDRLWRDIYRYVSNEKSSELNRLRKVILVSAGEGETPKDGLKISLEYKGDIWKFEQRTLKNGSILIKAESKDVNVKIKDGFYDEELKITTNNPKKETIVLQFHTNIAGEHKKANPFK